MNNKNEKNQMESSKIQPKSCECGCVCSCGCQRLDTDVQQN